MRLGVGWCWSTVGRTRWGEFAMGGVRSVGVVVEAPLLDDHAASRRLSRRHELSSSSRSRPLKDSIQAFYQGLPGSMNIAPCRSNPAHRGAAEESAVDPRDRRPQPCRPDHHTPTGARRTQPDPDPPPHRRRARHLSHHPPQRTPSRHLHRTRCRHAHLGQRRQHLTHPQLANLHHVGEPPPNRVPRYQARRVSPVKVGQPA